MTKLSFYLKLAAAVLLMSAWSGTTWAQDVLQFTADATQVSENFDGMWDAGGLACGAPDERSPHGGQFCCRIDPGDVYWRHEPGQ